MGILRGLVRRIAFVLRPRQGDRELDAEIRFHLEEETAALVRAGVPEPEARRRARVARIDPIKTLRSE